MCGGLVVRTPDCHAGGPGSNPSEIFLRKNSFSVCVSPQSLSQNHATFTYLLPWMILGQLGLLDCLGSNRVLVHILFKTATRARKPLKLIL